MATIDTSTNTYTLEHDYTFGADEQHRLVPVRRLPHDVEAGVHQEQAQRLADDDVVVGQDEAHRDSGTGKRRTHLNASM